MSTLQETQNKLLNNIDRAEQTHLNGKDRAFGFAMAAKVIIERARALRQRVRGIPNSFDTKNPHHVIFLSQLTGEVENFIWAGV